MIRVGVWTINPDGLRNNETISALYSGSLGEHSINFTHRELSDLRHAVDQTIKQVLRDLPPERRLEV